ncbi:hypothetical protein [Rhizobium paknamense]|uniref:Na+/H+-dicarboxylate symporter n=1 Tax=Rhizobium paknamense TaxID=1206817 RepID=A0ABU0IBD3_9HYPH|nr:hypothetical protein [Rhizobium paknamense]MDQ0455539.1 Na+/H+-dicarboxylate symporter [Rhizobium paknamense]
MTFLIAMAVGIATGATRSLMAILLVSVLMVVSFVAAAFWTGGSVALLDLLLALAGYNVGLIDCLLLMAAFASRKTA